MGALLSLLRNDGDVNTSIFVDFENAKPTAEEHELYAEITAKTSQQQKDLLGALRTYSGCGEQIRKAISSPSKQTEDEAWQAVSPAVGQLQEFFIFSTVLEECFAKLLRQLCVTTGSTTIKSNLEKYQATALLVAQLLTFALDFDDLKMTNPSIQNDFSYYRRTLSRLKMSAEHKEMLERAVVKDEMANRMSLFYAYPTPMLRALTDGLAAMTDGKGPNQLQTDNVTECLATMVTVCHVAVSQNKFTNQDTMAFCLRVLVACIILYDHIHPKGAFVKDSDIQVKAHIKLIQMNGGARVDGLLNALRYTTKHLNDESTPKATKALLV